MSYGTGIGEGKKRHRVREIPIGKPPVARPTGAFRRYYTESGTRVKPSWLDIVLNGGRCGRHCGPSKSFAVLAVVSRTKNVASKVDRIVEQSGRQTGPRLSHTPFNRFGRNTFRARKRSGPSAKRAFLFRSHAYRLSPTSRLLAKLFPIPCHFCLLVHGLIVDFVTRLYDSDGPAFTTLWHVYEDRFAGVVLKTTRATAWRKGVSERVQQRLPAPGDRLSTTIFKMRSNLFARIDYFGTRFRFRPPFRVDGRF